MRPDGARGGWPLQRILTASRIIGLTLLFAMLAGLTHASPVLPASIRLDQSATGGPVPFVPTGGYLLAIEQVMSRASDLNRDIKYLAIDAESLVGHDEKARDAIFENLEQYGLTILDKGREELEAEGYIENLTFKEGLLIDIAVRKMGARTLWLDAALYRSGAGAYGWRGMALTNRNGQWEIEQAGACFVA